MHILIRHLLMSIIRCIVEFREAGLQKSSLVNVLFLARIPILSQWILWLVLFMHSKNTCVAHTQVCDLENTTLLSYMKDTRLCWLDTSACVESDNTSLVWHMFQHTKNFLPPRGANLQPHASQAGVLSTRLSLTLLKKTLLSYLWLIWKLCIIWLNWYI